MHLSVLPLGLCQVHQLLKEEWVVQPMIYQYLKGSFRKQTVILVYVLLGLHQIIHLVGCYHQMCP